MKQRYAPVSTDVNGYAECMLSTKNCCSSVKNGEMLEEMCCLCRKCKSSKCGRCNRRARFWIDVNFVEAAGRCCPSMWEIRMWYKNDVNAKAVGIQTRGKSKAK
ncbi:hypothetical protein Mgra_00004944 [Meloidogyne graminicola]|uniref:Uncharacterized protein n=1 Tax=Meloidogyne graminicola TaxID=189291 RepID=A0A8S9ZQI6_9BILA|nr:hypothetical protein Mgra_00004944 [Meloidogyne graminicola]